MTVTVTSEHMQEIGRLGGRAGRGTVKGKLLPEQVLAIRADDRSHREIAKSYEINHSTVGRIKRRELWEHLD